ncbi:MAG: amidohydrolase/deacetylase family metallohydrolase [Mariniphaga sp.]
MQKLRPSIVCMLLLLTGFVHAQTYNIVIKGGHLIDPKNKINELMDIAIKDGRIAAVARNIDAKLAIQVVNAEGLYITPGLIDMHAHVFAGTEPDRGLSNGLSAVPPDAFTFRVGITTIVDVGGAGWKSFPVFKRNIIDNAQTRVLALLNIVGEGMRGGAYEQDPADMDPKLTALVAGQYKKYIVGIKLAHYSGADWTPTDKTVEAGKLAHLPVMIDFGAASPPLSIEELFMKHLRPGDIYTHVFALLDGNIRETVVDEQLKKVKPFMWEAQKKGILFDVGFGGGSFNFSQALPAIKSGFYPNSISTDLHTGSMNSAMKNLLNVMSIFLVMGMDLPDVIKATTWNPALAIHREDLGNLSVGSEADVAILKMEKGRFGFWDKTGYKMDAEQKLECEMTVREGRIVYDLNGIAKPIVLK